ncbi:MAG: hypothetical protein H8E35_02220 [Ardenticatenia bacterium]|nr:hypothetical protein [Ardenticatenia bacterium]
MRTRINTRLHDPTFMRLALRLAIVAMMVLLASFNASLDAPAYAQDPGEGTDPGGGDDIGTGLATLTKIAVDALIVLAALVMTVGLAFSGVGGQVAAMAGVPHAQASAIMRIAALVGFFLLTVFTIPLANAIIDNVGKFKSTDAIHIPK